MEYSEWVKWEKEYPWLWAIVGPGSGHLDLRAIGCKRATYEAPLNLPKPRPESRIWIVLGSWVQGFLQPRVFDVKEIIVEPRISIRQQLRKRGSPRFGQHGLYLVVGTVEPYPVGDDLVIYKRPYGVEDFRSLLY